MDRREREDDIASSDEEGRLSFWFRRFEGSVDWR